MNVYSTPIRLFPLVVEMYGGLSIGRQVEAKQLDMGVVSLDYLSSLAIYNEHSKHNIVSLYS